MSVLAKSDEDGVDLSTPVHGDEEIRAMQRAIPALFARWEITDAQAAILLGGVSTKTVQRWRDGAFGRAGRDLADRMSHILGIHKALRLLFADPARGYAWIRKPNAAFGGVSALEVMLRGGMEDLQRVRRYLDSARGGW
ncbi:MAG: MbcA/ParS/Xre antitoxin family protein [Paracoccaceae bacterium]